MKTKLVSANIILHRWIPGRGPSTVQQTWILRNMVLWSPKNRIKQEPSVFAKYLQCRIMKYRMDTLWFYMFELALVPSGLLQELLLSHAFDTEFVLLISSNSIIFFSHKRNWHKKERKRTFEKHQFKKNKIYSYEKTRKQDFGSRFEISPCGMNQTLSAKVCGCYCAFGV